MQTTYGIKNFRVFDENGENVSISPITIITGRNSSGKSSIVKSALLLSSFLKNVKSAYTDRKKVNLKKYSLDFRQYPNNTLGRYDRIVNFDSTDSRITFSYSIYSLLLSQDVTIVLTFYKDKNDTLDNGYLEGFQIVNKEGHILYASDDSHSPYCDVCGLQPMFIEFAILQTVWHSRVGIESAYGIEETVSKEEYEEQVDIQKKISAKFSKRIKANVVDYSLYTDNEHLFSESLEDDWLAWSYDSKSLFYIPLVEYLSKLDKASTIKYVNEHFVDESTNADKLYAINKLLTAFSESKCSTLFEYQLELEKMWFAEESQCRTSAQFSLLHNGGPSAYYSISIPQDYVFQLMHADAKPIAVSCDDAKECPEDSRPLSYKDSIKELPVDFAMFYEVIMDLNEAYELGDTDCVVKHEAWYNFMGPEYSHRLANAFASFINSVIEEALTPVWAQEMTYVSSSRVMVKRLYTLDDNSDFTQLLKRYFDARREYLKNHDKDFSRRSLQEPKYVADDFITKWVRKFGIGDHISIDMDAEGLGVSLRLFKTNGKSTLLADEGYGMTQLLSILLQIETSILSANDKVRNRYYNINLGNGFTYAERTISMEEPEIHLHPQYQSLLADMLVDAYLNYNVHFLVETHSEYLIRKLQSIIANPTKERKLDRSDVAILYVNEADPALRLEGEPHIKSITIQKDGYLSSEFGPGFFDEAGNLSRELL